MFYVVGSPNCFEYFIPFIENVINTFRGLKIVVCCLITYTFHPCQRVLIVNFLLGMVKMVSAKQA